MKVIVKIRCFHCEGQGRRTSTIPGIQMSGDYCYECDGNGHIIKTIVCEELLDVIIK